MRNSRWVRLLAYVTGSVNHELLLRNEYLAAENRILRAKLSARLCLSNPERVTLAEIAKRLGRKAVWSRNSCGTLVVFEQTEAIPWRRRIFPTV